MNKPVHFGRPVYLEHSKAQNISENNQNQKITFVLEILKKQSSKERLRVVLQLSIVDCSTTYCCTRLYTSEEAKY